MIPAVQLTTLFVILIRALVLLFRIIAVHWVTFSTGFH